MKTALFPISVDNRRFSSAFTAKILKPVVEEHNEIVFLIADELQLYNKACEVGQSANLKEVLAGFSSRNCYFEERKTWLQKLLREIAGKSNHPGWKFKSLADITDHGFYEIYRNLTLAFHTVPEFHNDVVEEATRYCRKKQIKHSEQMERRLSEAYILEEIAVNIRLRVCENIAHEYYPFGYFRPMLRIYSDDYGVNALNLAGVSFSHDEFSFFQWNDATGSWELVPKTAHQEAF